MGLPPPLAARTRELLASTQVGTKPVRTERPNPGAGSETEQLTLDFAGGRHEQGEPLTSDLERLVYDLLDWARANGRSAETTRSDSPVMPPRKIAPPSSRPAPGPDVIPPEL